MDDVVFYQIVTKHKEWLDSNGARGAQANLEGAHLEDKNLTGVNLKHAILIGAHFDRSILRGCNLIGADITAATFKGTRTEWCMVNFSKGEYEQAKQFIEGLLL